MTNETGSEDEDVVPEALLDWIAAGRPDPMPPEVTLWREQREDADAQIASLAGVWRATEAPAAPTGALQDLRTRLPRRTTLPARGARARARVRWPLQAAAAVLLLIIGALAGPQLLDRFGADDGALARVEVPAGASVQLDLPGGVKVQLNAGSTLTYAAGTDELRDVVLEGEGYFQVRHDPSRTFTVHTESGVIRDLGTAFGVRARDGAVSVVVTEGIVELEAGGQAVEVGAGYTSSAIRGQAPTAAEPAEPLVALAWTEGRMVFIDQTLGTIAEDLSRRFGVEVQVAPRLLDQKVTASVGAPSDIDNALGLITLAAGARYERTPTGWRITAR